VETPFHQTVTRATSFWWLAHPLSRDSTGGTQVIRNTTWLTQRLCCNINLSTKMGMSN